MHVPEPHLSTSFSLVTRHFPTASRSVVGCSPPPPCCRPRRGGCARQRRSHDHTAKTTILPTPQPHVRRSRTAGWRSPPGSRKPASTSFEKARRRAASPGLMVMTASSRSVPHSHQMAHDSPTGRRWDEDMGYQDAALVIADLTAAGEVTTTATIAVDDITLPPCPIWSADGRWVAFGAGARNPAADPAYVTEVWVVDIETSDIRQLSGLNVSDIEWAPDATDLYIASGGIVVYSVATDQLRPLGDTSGVENFAVSPDGESIAFQRRRPADQVTVPTASPGYTGLGPGPSGLDRDLWLMDADGREERILAAEYTVGHGIGPVWSPDGDHIAYQRSCVVLPPGHRVLPRGARGCRRDRERQRSPRTRWYRGGHSSIEQCRTRCDSCLVPLQYHMVARRHDTPHSRRRSRRSAVGRSDATRRPVRRRRLRYDGYPSLPFQSWSRVP